MAERSEGPHIVAALLQLVGWAIVAVYVLVAMDAWVSRGQGLAAAAAYAPMILAGLVLALLAQVAKAVLRIAENSDEMLELARKRDGQR